MTLREARELVKAPLQFGNEEQRRASKLIALADEVNALIAENNLTCSECDGAGETECYECGSTCDCTECDGTGGIPPIGSWFTEERIKKVHQEVLDEIQ